MRASGIINAIQSPWLVLPSLAVVLRFFSFFPSVIDHDESTYIVIAKALLEGQTYFRDVIDTKPIGIFWIYAAIQSLGLDSIFLMRLVPAIAIGLTGVLMLEFCRRWLGNKLAAWTAGICYILMISLYKRWGLSPNTELYFNALNLAALYLVLFSNSRLKDLLAGIAFGSAAMIKYVSITAATATGLFLLWRAYHQKQFLAAGVLRGSLLLLGFAIPVLIVTGYFNAKGALSEFWFYTVQVTGRYPSHMTWSGRMEFVLDFSLRFIPIVWMAITALRVEAKKQNGLQLLFILWLMLDLIIIMIPGKNFGHYFIQMMLPISLLAGAFLDSPVGSRWRKQIRQRFSTSTLYLFLSLPLIAIVLGHYFSFSKPDPVREVASYLEKELKQGDRIYTGNSQHILYYLLGQTSPTPYIHSSLLWNQEHVQALQIDLDLETKRILEANPRFILMRDPVPDKFMKDTHLSNYHLNKTFANGTFLYERN